MDRVGIVLAALAAPAAMAQTWSGLTPGTVPPLSVQAGMDLGGTPLYICRTTDSQGLAQIGKYATSIGCVYFYNGLAVAPTSFQVLTNFSVEWIPSANGTVPANAYKAGLNGDGSVYVCRAWVEGSRQVGQLRNNSSGCAIEFGGSGGVFTSYEVLRSPWLAAANGAIPSGSIQAGSDPGPLPLYICRAVVNGVQHIGKLRSDFNGCRIGLGNSINVAPSYEVLANLNNMTYFWQTFTSPVPAGGAFFAGGNGTAAKYACRYVIPGTNSLTPGQTGAGFSNVCEVEYDNGSKNSSVFEALQRSDPPTNCTYSVSSASLTISGFGNAGNPFAITVTSNCGWVNFPSAAWIEVNKRAGTGNQTFTIGAGANNTGATRSGTVSVGGKTIAISQGVPCAGGPAITPTALEVPPQAVQRQLQISTPATCQWTLVNVPSWITPPAITGSGSATYTFQIAANNSTTPRTATLNFSGTTVTVSQAGYCTYALNPSGTSNVPASGVSFILGIVNTQACEGATLQLSGSSIAASPAATPGFFFLQIQPNPNYGAPRTITFSMSNGQTFSFTQHGQPCTVTANPPAVTIPGTGASFSVQVNVPSQSCSWTATPANASFVTFTSALSGQGNGTILGTVGASGVNRSATLNFASYQATGTAAINQTGIGCTYSMNPSSADVPNPGGPLSVNVTTEPGCPVSFSAQANWVTVPNPGAGSGNYILNVLASPEYAERSQAVRLGGGSLQIRQAGKPCSITPGSVPVVASSGGNVSINVSTPSPSCQLTLSYGNTWLHMSGTSPYPGTTTLTGSVDANPGSSLRSVQMRITSYLASVQFNIAQSGASCTYSASPLSTSFTAAGGSQTITVTTLAGCDWTAFDSDSWIVFPSTSSGTGSGSFQFTVQANTNSATRTGAVQVAGKTISVSQTGATCSYTLSSNGVSVPATATPVLVNLTTNAGCIWNVTLPDIWVTAMSALSGTGNGAVAFNVLANPSANQRTSSLTIAGKTFTITQAGTAVGNNTSGMTFVALPPCRILETRSDYNFEGRSGAFGPPYINAGETRTLSMNSSSLCPIPIAAKAYVVNLTLVPRGAVDFVTVWPAGETRPNVWSIRSPDGNTVANSAIVKAGSNGGISVYASHNTDLLIDVSGYFTDNPAQSNLVYYPLTPCRVIDTRLDYRPAGPFGAPSMGNRETRAFRFPDYIPCHIPTGAGAYSMTITAVPKGPLQFLTAWPGGTNQPNVSSSNSPLGRVLANSVVLPSSPDGTINVHTFNASDFLIDINGYFAPDDGSSGQFYFPVTQCRANDSTVTGGIYNDDTTRTIDVPIAAGCPGIPATARGYALNVTALPNNSPMPFITAYPTGQPRPNISILNAFEGQIVTNSAIVPAGVTGKIDIYAYRRTNVVVEVSGYFGR
ncbi:MAG: DUF3421 domain-containing protein [Acidobacteria bacterium]|nr:DUF3421 domain-containing protein [Acidobacteriota bacterium]